MYRLRKSALETVSSCYIIRFLVKFSNGCLYRSKGLSLTLLILYHCEAATPNLIHAEYLKIAKFWVLTWITVNLCLETFQKWKLGKIFANECIAENILYQTDSIAAIVIGAAWLAFPKWLLHRQVKVPLDESHELCARIMGAFFTSSCVIGSHVLYWKELKDRLIGVDARACVRLKLKHYCVDYLERYKKTICTLTLVAQIWSQYAYWRDWNESHWIGISLISTWMIICVVVRFYLTVRMKRSQNIKKLS
ncbi:unnamed protein product [Thelazia callipaeda]|uniref:TLC domain-containing protein n=1 Tax=Thelazia callipaeda TaxID=103827 RepID=A0A0N5CKI9_THECL|nr:unnamed protein product [Thelazia callipaeda]